MLYARTREGLRVAADPRGNREAAEQEADEGERQTPERRRR